MPELPLGMVENDVSESMINFKPTGEELTNYDEEVSLNKESMYALM